MNKFSSSTLKVRQYMKAGDTYRNFVIKAFQDLPEIDSKLLEAEHKPTGASILMLINDDDENVFNICFRTTPNLSNGVAHILEHMVLCGSKNYPVRDPFFSMTRRSLNTFMNAFTGADFTCYPAASQIPEDFYNLLSIYIDAVFYPLLTYNSFIQEGWRYELSPEKKLAYTGVVFNEMKGALMSGESRLMEALNAALFPDVLYGVNSGGDPKDIVTLSHEDVIAFHESQYSLNRCLFYFYGNIKPSSHLDFLEEKLLRDVGKLEKVSVHVPTQKRFKEPIRETMAYPADSNDMDKVLFGLTWLTCSILDQQELLALSVLEVVLMGTDAAPLKSRLLKSGCCKQTDMIMDNDIREIPITILCKGCSHGSAQKLESLIFACLEEIANEGIPNNLVEGAVHQLELSRKEITGYSLPYGLSLFFRSGLLKQHGGQASDGLKIHSLFSVLRKDLENKDYLPSLIRKYFLKNTHFARIILVPDSLLIAKEDKDEQDGLEKKQALLSQEDIQAIVQKTEDLELYQNTEENVDEILPGLTLDKIPTTGKEFVLLKHEHSSAATVFRHECFTNDIVFSDLVMDLPSVSAQDLPWFKLMVYLAPQLGCGDRSYKEHLEYLLEHTGGVDVVYDFSPNVLDYSKLNPTISVRGKALNSNVGSLFRVLKDVSHSVNFSDKERIQELMMQHHESVTNSVRNNPMSYAIGQACAGMSIVSKMSYLSSGLSYARLVHKFMSSFNEEYDEFIDRIKLLYDLSFTQSYHLLCSCSEANYQSLLGKDFYNLFEHTDTTKVDWMNPEIELVSSSMGFIIPTKAAFNAMSFPLEGLSYDHVDAAVLTIAAEILDNVVLHTKIREQGGAYGSGAALNLMRGSFYCYSYRDPEIANTYAAFRSGIQTIAEGNFSDKDIREAILGIVQSLDAPIPPGGRAAAGFYRIRCGKTPVLRQAFRQSLLSVTKDQICDVVKRYLLDKIDQAIFVSFAGENMFQEKKPILNQEFIVQPVL